MKSFFLFLLVLAIGFGGYIAFKWVSEDDTTIGEQVEIVKDRVSEGYEDTAVSNTAESASKLGKVLKGSLDEAQGVFEHGAEAKYE
jgi:hypothetical protein